MWSLIITSHFHNQCSRLREHFNDWAACENGSLTDVTSSVEADSDATQRVIHYILHHALHAMCAMGACMAMCAMGACMEILPFLSHWLRLLPDAFLGEDVWKEEDFTTTLIWYLWCLRFSRGVHYDYDGK